MLNPAKNSKPLALCVLCFCLLGVPARLMLFAQETPQPSPSIVERKNRAPVSREMLTVKLPKPAEFKLKNGVTVLVMEDHRAPFISVQLHIMGAGALFEPPALPGLAGTTAQMLREGTNS